MSLTLLVKCCTTAVTTVLAILTCAVAAQAAQASGQCNFGPYRNTTLTIVVSVRPAPGQHWLFDEAPSAVAKELLRDLNDNAFGVQFVEANGEAPFMTAEVVMNETNAGTRQDSATARISGIGFQIDEQSGSAPFTSWKPAIGALAQRILSEWIRGGWHMDAACPRGSRGVDRSGGGSGSGSTSILHTCNASGAPQSIALAYRTPGPEPAWTAAGWYSIDAGGCRDITLRAPYVAKYESGGYGLAVAAKASMSWTLPNGIFLSCSKDEPFETKSTSFPKPGYGDCPRGFNKTPYASVSGSMMSNVTPGRATLTLPP